MQRNAKESILCNIGLLRVFEPIEYRDWEQLGGEK
jgi:hypothetical protein